MSVLKRGYFGLLAAIAMLLSSCSSSTVAPSDSALAVHWTAANENYVAGDFLKAIDHLDRLLEGNNSYAPRALPMSLAISSGVAAGYMDLADCYARGARASKSNKAKAAAFLAKASEYRSLANHMVLRFAENSRKTDRLVGNPVQISFGPPKGTVAEPPLFAAISNGTLPARADEDEVLGQAVARGVQRAVCDILGAHDNLPKVASQLQRGAILLPRQAFVKSVAGLLDRESDLYSRTKLDDAAKLSMLQDLARSVQAEPAGSQSAMVLPASSTK